MAEVAAILGAKKQTAYYYQKRLPRFPEPIKYRHPETGRSCGTWRQYFKDHDRPGRGARTDVARKKTEAELRLRRRDESGQFVANAEETDTAP